MSEVALQACVDRHLEHAAMNFRLDDELGTQHGLAWSDFVLLSVLDDAGGTLPALQLAQRLRVQGSRILLQLRPLEKIGLVERAPGRVTLRASGRRLLREARETAGAVCAELRRA